MSHAEPHSPLEIERRRNRATADAWSWYAEHRAKVTALLERLVEDANGASLCLLGAGNLNDVDLGRLRTRYKLIDLLDWDVDAMQQGLRRQSVDTEQAIRVFGPIDLCSCTTIGSGNRDDGTLARRDYDTVASLCLLSQLIDQTAQTLGANHAQLLATIQEVRQRHLQLLANHLRPGGKMLLVTDFVSSDTCPELLTLDGHSVPSAAHSWLNAGNFFTGLNPAVVRQSLLDDPDIAPCWSDVRLHAPWRWRISARRAYAVCAFEATRSDAVACPQRTQ
jgi:hypothetical protein